MNSCSLLSSLDQHFLNPSVREMEGAYEEHTYCLVQLREEGFLSSSTCDLMVREKQQALQQLQQYHHSMLYGDLKRVLQMTILGLGYILTRTVVSPRLIDRVSPFGSSYVLDGVVALVAMAIFIVSLNSLENRHMQYQTLARREQEGLHSMRETMVVVERMRARPQGSFTFLGSLERAYSSMSLMERAHYCPLTPREHFLQRQIEKVYKEGTWVHSSGREEADDVADFIRRNEGLILVYDRASDCLVKMPADATLVEAILRKGDQSGEETVLQLLRSPDAREPLCRQAFSLNPCVYLTRSPSFSGMLTRES